MKEIKFKNIIMLTLAGLINAFGITVFLAPVKLYDSGISGTAMLLSQLTPEWLSLSVFLNPICKKRMCKAHPFFIIIHLQSNLRKFRVLPLHNPCRLKSLQWAGGEFYYS